MSTAIGTWSAASGNSSVALGQQSDAIGTDSAALGAYSIATGNDSTATGVNSYAYGVNSTANGYAATATGDYSSAIGSNSSAGGTNSTAIGANASAAANNSVALGSGSVANQENTVSVGNAATGLTRRITNVAEGVAPNDAVNVEQLNSVVSQSTTQNQAYAKTQAQTSGAVAAAGVNASVAAMGQSGTNHLAVGTGVMGGQAGFGVAYARSFTGWSASVNVSTNGSSDYTQVGGGIGLGW
jgi:autotransporter adhesin